MVARWYGETQSQYVLEYVEDPFVRAYVRNSYYSSTIKEELVRCRTRVTHAVAKGIGFTVENQACRQKRTSS